MHVVMQQNCRIVDVGIVISVLTNQGEHFLQNDYIKRSVAKQNLSPYQVMKAAKGIQGSALQALQSVFDHQRSLDDSSSTMLGPKSQHGLGSRGVVSNSGERGSGRSSTTIARGATARPLGTRLIKTALASSADATDIALQGQALFNLKDSRKGDRERAGFRKFKFEDAGRREQPQDVEVDMVKYFREDLHRKLLSPDFKKQIDGLELLQKVFFIDCVPQMEYSGFQLDVILCFGAFTVF
jgi:hypothetical protein